MSKLRDLWLVLKGELSSTTINAKQAENNFLAKTIREYDDRIWQMSQCSSWDAMRPHYLKILERTVENKNKEHDRIRAIMVPELERTYGRE